MRSSGNMERRDVPVPSVGGGDPTAHRLANWSLVALGCVAMLSFGLGLHTPIVAPELLVAIAATAGAALAGAALVRSANAGKGVLEATWSDRAAVAHDDDRTVARWPHAPRTTDAVELVWPHDGPHLLLESVTFPYGTRMTKRPHESIRGPGRVVRQPWVIVSLDCSDRPALYYPQVPITILDDGTVLGGMPPITVGYPGDEGKVFGVHLVVADKAADTFLRKTLQEWEMAMDYRGLRSEDLPDLVWILKTSVVRV